MTARIGFDHYTIAHRGFTAEATLEFARAHRFDGVQFLEPAAIDRSLEPARLRAFRAKADAMGLYLEVGLPSPNPVRRSREIGSEVSPAELAVELGSHLDALRELGCAHARLYIGDRHDRFRMDTPWDLQIAASLAVIRHLTPLLKERGIRLAIETHGDLTVDELLGIVDALDPEVAGITLDTGNLLMRLDDPLTATERLAPWVLGTHVKDAALEFTRAGCAGRPGRSGPASCRCPICWPRSSATVRRLPCRSSFIPGPTTYPSTMRDGWASSPRCVRRPWPPSSTWRSIVNADMPRRRSPGPR